MGGNKRGWVVSGSDMHRGELVVVSLGGKQCNVTPGAKQQQPSRDTIKNNPVNPTAFEMIFLDVKEAKCIEERLLDPLLFGRGYLR